MSVDTLGRQRAERRALAIRALAEHYGVNESDPELLRVLDEVSVSTPGEYAFVTEDRGEPRVWTEGSFQAAAASMGEQVLSGEDVKSGIFDLDSGEHVHVNVATPVVTRSEDQDIEENPLRPTESAIPPSREQAQAVVYALLAYRDELSDDPNGLDAQNIDRFLSSYAEEPEDTPAKRAERLLHRTCVQLWPEKYPLAEREAANVPDAEEYGAQNPRQWDAGTIEWVAEAVADARAILRGEVRA